MQLHTGRVGYTCSARGRPRSVHTGAITVVRPPPAARIGIRDGKFYDRVTGVVFVPRGSNYIRLAPQTDPSGYTFSHHSTFDVGRYGAPRVDAALARMQASGYNVVRVFFSGVCLSICLGDPRTGGLRWAYLENVADFVRRAKAHGIQVMLTMDALPAGSTWSARVHASCCTAYGGFQQEFLPAESVAAMRDYYTALVEGLLDAGMPADGVFAYSLVNEAFMDGDRPPFSLRSGTLTTANGQTYDLSAAADRRRMLEDGLVYWADVMVDAIHRVVPSSLVTVGFFHADGPNPARRGDPRLIYTNEFLRRSRVDFFDFHPYPDDELTFPQFMQNYGVTGGEEKPLLMGEFGGSRRVYRTPEEAAAALQRWQSESCAWGFDGWLLWTWDTEEQEALWNGLSAGGVIERALAPRRRVDPCALVGQAEFGHAAGRQFDVEIVAIDLAGRRTNLTRNPAWDSAPAVSRDGRIVFLSTRDGTADFYVREADGDTRRLTIGQAVWNEALDISQASWSPSGRSIAFDSLGGPAVPNCSRLCASWDVRVIDSDGRGLRQVALRARAPSWSRDGSRLAFLSDVDAEGAAAGVTITRLDGSGSVRVTGFNHESDVGPVWSPRSDELAFQASAADGRPTSIYLVAGNGTRKRRLAVGHHPAWSPDGRRLAFIDNYKLFTIDRNGQGRRQLSRKSEFVIGAAWSPRGGRLGYVAGTTANRYGGLPRNLRIQIVTANGNRVRVLARQTPNSLIWGPPVWTPDGKRVLVAVEAH